MPDRSVVVRLRAEIAGFKQAMSDAAKAVRGVSDATGDTEEQTKSLVDRMRESAEEHQQAWEKVGKTMLVAGGVIGAGVGLAVKAFADFDKEMSLVRAVSGATSAEMEKLSAAALQAGADTKFSASEAAQATGELAKVGISTADILGGALRGSLDLAAAGNLDLANAAEISGQAMKLFGLQGKDVGHIADVLAAGANKSAADVTDLAQALSQGGLVAAQTGLNLDQTVGTLSAFADNALMGSDAGTSFKTMLQRLNPQSEQAKNLMEQLGLSAYDAQGNFVGIANYAGQLQDALGKMSTEQRNAAMQTLFGSDAVRAATVLYNLGAKGVQGYVDAVNDQGAATRNAAINMDNLAGDIEQLKGSIETGLIEAGSGANDSLRTLVQSGTAAVNFVSALPAPLLQVGLGLAAVTSAALLTGGAVTMLSAKAAAARATMLELGITSEATAGRMTTAAKGAGILAAAIVGVTAAGAAFDTFIGRQAAGLNEAGQSLLAYSKAGRDAKGVTDLTSAGFKDLDKSINLALRSGAWSATKEFFADFATLSIVPTGMDEAKEFFKEIDSGLSNLVSSGHADEAQKLFDQVAAAAQKQGFSIAQVNDLLPSYAAALSTAQAQAQGAIAPTEQLGGSIDGVQVSAKDAADAIDKLVQSLADAGLVQLSTREAARQYQQAIADARKEAEKGAKTLSIHSAEGRKNQAALDGQAEAAIRQAQAIYESTKATKGTGPAEEAFRKSLVGSRAALVETARKFGMGETAAERYADKVLGIPAVKSTKVTLSGADAAITEATRIARAIAKIPGRKTIDVVTRKIGAQGEKFSANGGFIAGPGGPRDDAIPAMLSNGEFVVNAAATSRHRSLLESINGQKFADGGMAGYVQHFATGGRVKKKKPVDPLISLRSQYSRYLDTDIVGSLIGEPDAVLSEAVQRINTAFDKITTITDKLAKSHKKAARELEHAAASSERAMSKLADQRDAAVDRLKESTDRLADLQKQSDDYAASVAGKALGGGALDVLFGRGQDGPASLADVEAGMQAQIDATRRFDKLIGDLSDMGLQDSLLQQIIDKGPGEGGPMGQAILDGGQEAIRKFNSLQTDLEGAADRLGQKAAKDMYGAGIDAAQGLVDGLASQQSAIEAQMVKIATAIQKSIRKALDMHSPSRLLMGIGAQAGESVALGLGSSLGRVQAQSSRLAVAMTPRAAAGRASGMSGLSDADIGRLIAAIDRRSARSGPLVAVGSVREEADAQMLAREFDFRLSTQGLGA